MLLKDRVSKISNLLGWRYDMAHSMYLIFPQSENAHSVYEKIKALAPKGAFFIVTELARSDTSRTQGWLTTDSVYVITHGQIGPSSAKS